MIGPSESNKDFDHIGSLLTTFDLILDHNNNILRRNGHSNCEPLIQWSMILSSWTRTCVNGLVVTQHIRTDLQIATA